MVAHRKNVPTPQAYVPSSWFIVLTVLVVVGAAGWLGWLFVDDDPPTVDTTSAGAVSPSAPADPSPAATATPKPEKSKPKPEPTVSSAAARGATVSVLNNSGVRGAARAFSVKVTDAGWPLGGIGNWTGSIGSNTIYYPAGLQEQAELLAKDVDIERLRPSVAPMRMDRLTIILSGPQ
jgi:hypothetical protein